MDEPLSNLDAKLRGHMRSELKRLQADLGVTTIYVTHDQIEAMTLAHRVAIMNRGVVQQIAAPRQIYDDPANLFVAGFIGSPPMNLLQGELVEGSFVCPDGRFRTSSVESRAKVTAGLRPEDCRVTGPAEGKIAARVYAVELIGDHTLITCQFGDATLTVKADKSAHYEMDEAIGIDFADAAVFLFDSETGERIRGRVAGAAMLAQLVLLRLCEKVAARSAAEGRTDEASGRACVCACRERWRMFRRNIDDLTGRSEAVHFHVLIFTLQTHQAALRPSRHPSSFSAVAARAPSTVPAGADEGRAPTSKHFCTQPHSASHSRPHRPAPMHHPAPRPAAPAAISMRHISPLALALVVTPRIRRR